MSADKQKSGEPAPFTFTAPAHWQLRGEAGSMNLDLTVEFCVQVGLRVAHTSPGTYRVGGTLEQIAKAAEWMTVYYPAPISFEIEPPPERVSVRFAVTPDRPPPRAAEVHGLQESERLVARAIDAGLTAQGIGIKHYRMTGPTRCHVAWMASLFNVSTERALEIMNLTAEQATAEDAALPLPPINVVLPVRQTVAQITRDARGDITQVKQTERTVK